MRVGANRTLGVAIVASILLHALLLALPVTRELSALAPPEPEPLVARVERPEPPPAPPRAPAREIRKPKPQRPEPIAKPAPAATGPTPLARVPVPPPAAAAAPVPAPAPAPLPAPVPRIDPSVFATVAPPASAVDVGALERYRQAVTRAAVRFKRYPRVAIDNNWEGEVVVLMAIGADGRLASLRVKRGSSYEVLDRQALQMFEDAKPFVPVPSELRGRAFELELRAIYNLRDQRSG